MRKERIMWMLTWIGCCCLIGITTLSLTEYFPFNWILFTLYIPAYRFSDWVENHFKG
jgi:hypothetical protein